MAYKSSNDFQSLVTYSYICMCIRVESDRENNNDLNAQTYEAGFDCAKSSFSDSCLSVS